MKLLNYTTLIFSGILFLLLSLWAVLFYFEMLDEIYDSLDDGLENQKMLVIQKVMENPELRGKSFQENNFRRGRPGQGAFLLPALALLRPHLKHCPPQ